LNGPKSRALKSTLAWEPTLVRLRWTGRIGLGRLLHQGYLDLTARDERALQAVGASHEGLVAAILDVVPALLEVTEPRHLDPGAAFEDRVRPDFHAASPIDMEPNAR
jgi:hypothetical protein